MFYLVLFVGVIAFLSIVALLDPSHRRRRSLGNGAGVVHEMDSMAATIAAIAATMVSRFGGANGLILRVPARVLSGERNEDRPCLTPIHCVTSKRCAGHCGCR